MIYTHINTWTNAHTLWLWFLLFSSSLSLSLRQLLVSNRIYKRWNNLCTHLPLMLGDIPAASVISYCLYWYAPCPVQHVGGYYVFLPRLFPLDKQTHSGLQTQLCVGYVCLIGSQNNSRERRKSLSSLASKLHRFTQSSESRITDKHAFDSIHTLDKCLFLRRGYIYFLWVSVYSPGVMIKSIQTDMLPSIHHNKHNSI